MNALVKTQVTVWFWVKTSDTNNQSGWAGKTEVGLRGNLNVNLHTWKILALCVAGVDSKKEKELFLKTIFCNRKAVKYCIH